MSDLTTIARPYARAIFELAMGSSDTLLAWANVLVTLAETVVLPEVSTFIQNPASTTEEQIELLLAPIERLKFHDLLQVKHLLSTLAQYRRLLVLPSIAAQYEQLRGEQEKTLTVDVLSFMPIPMEQQQRLIDALAKRLQRKIMLEITIDPSLLGGALIQAGDLVIDGSVKGRLLKLASTLAA